MHVLECFALSSALGSLGYGASHELNDFFWAKAVTTSKAFFSPLRHAIADNYSPQFQHGLVICLANVLFNRSTARALESPVLRSWKIPTMQQKVTTPYSRKAKQNDLCSCLWRHMCSRTVCFNQCLYIFLTIDAYYIPVTVPVCKLTPVTG